MAVVAVALLGGCSLLLDFGGEITSDGDAGVLRPDAQSGAPDARSLPDAIPRPDAPPGQCENGRQDADETGVDCGGSCPGCGVLGSCLVAADCATSACALGVCEAYPRDCASYHQALPMAPSGRVTLDIDGPGSILPADAWCEQTLAGGGWQLVSAIASTPGTPAPIVGAGTCIDPAAAACAGHVDRTQVTAATALLILDAPSGDYLIVDRFSASTTSSLRYLSRERAITVSDVCTAPHICSTTTIDPALRVTTSGYAMAYAAPLVQWWRYGGWYIGAGPSAGLLDGNVFRTGYNGNNTLSTRATAGGTSTIRRSGGQRLYVRVPAVPTAPP